MPLFGEKIKNVIRGLAGKPHREWLPENCKPLTLSDGDVLAMIEYLKKPKDEDYIYLVFGVVIFVICIILEIKVSTDISFPIVGAGLALLCVLGYFREIYIRKNNRVVNMLKLRQFTAYELPVTGKQRDTTSNRNCFCVMSGNRAFRVSRDEYKTVRGGQNAVAIFFNLTDTVSVLNLQNL
ncbi:MAG: hypothetical protein FWE27_02205 [Defluviitaleaceae bacterium]|nr:hypothetical protein [Defluviitaleaceae bacterium]